MSHDLESDHYDLDETMNLNLRQISQEKLSKFEGYAAEIFSALGMDLNTPATQETPRRFIKHTVEKK